jgi:hypothetical protein
MVLTIVALYHWPWTLYEGATTSSKSTPESPELNTSKGLWTTADIKRYVNSPEQWTAAKMIIACESAFS